MTGFDLVRHVNKITHSGFDATATQGLSVNNGAGATGVSFGSWTELISSAPYAANRLFLVCRTNVNEERAIHFSIGVGAAGAEQEVHVGYSILGNGQLATYSIEIPVFISKGQRVSVRTASNYDWTTVNLVGVLLEEDATPSSAIVDSTFIASGNSPIAAPVNVTTMPTADNSWSGWTELAASLNGHVEEVVLYIQIIGRTGGEGAENIAFQLGKGVAGAETPISQELIAYLGSWDANPDPGFFVAKCNTIKGERLSIRYASDNYLAHTPYSYNVVWTAKG